MEINRLLYQQVIDHLKPNKVNVITGTRRVGKTFLVQKIIANTHYRVFVLEGEDIDAQNLLSPASIANYKRIFSGYDLIVIDEAQAIPDTGEFPMDVNATILRMTPDALARIFIDAIALTPQASIP